MQNKIKQKTRRVVNKIIENGNVPRIVCQHLVGENHTFTHRFIVGVIVMGVGVCVAHIHVEMFIMQYCVDGVGYLIHGIGAIPIAERVLRNNKTKELEKEAKEFLEGE